MKKKIMDVLLTDEFIQGATLAMLVISICGYQQLHINLEKETLKNKTLKDLV